MKGFDDWVVFQLLVELIAKRLLEACVQFPFFRVVYSEPRGKQSLKLTEA